MADKNPFLQNPFDKLADDISSSTYELPEYERIQSAPATSGPVQAPADFAPLFQEAADKYGVPANVLMALAQQESSFNPDAIGPQTKWGRAKGIMQYLDSTAEAMGINPFDPAQAIDAAARQMSERLANGYTVEEAIMAHHGGDNRDLWGPKTRRYGQEVLSKAGDFSTPQPQTARAPRPEMSGLGGGEPALPFEPYSAGLDEFSISLTDPTPTAGEGQPLPLIEKPDIPKAKAPGADEDDEEGGSILTDLGNLLAIGADEAALNFREGVRQVFGDSVVDAIDKADKWLNGKESKKFLEERINRNTGELTEDTQAAREKEWISEGKDGYALGPAWTDWRSYASGLVQSLPETAMVMAPSGILAKGVYAASLARGASKVIAAKRAATTATVAGGITEGFFGGGATARDVAERISQVPDETLLTSDAVKALMDEGMSLDQARQVIAEDASTKAFVLGGTATAVFGGAGDRVLAKILTEGAGSRLTAALRGAVAEGVFEEAPQEAAHTAISNYVVTDADPAVRISEGVLNAAAGGAVIGGTMGAGLGAAAGGRRAEDGPALDGTVGQSDGPAPGGPLERAMTEAQAEEAVASTQGQRVRVRSDAGEIGGVVEEYTEDGQGGFSARILADDGMLYDFTQADNVQINLDTQGEVTGDDVDGGVPDVGAAGPDATAAQPIDQPAAGEGNAGTDQPAGGADTGELVADSGAGVPVADLPADAEPSLIDLPEPDDTMVVRSNGSPFASEGNARQAMRNRRLSGYEPVEVRGGWALAPTQAEERPAVPSLRATGERDTVSTPAGRDLDVEYALVEAGDLVTSNDATGNVNPDYPAELQPRDRSRVASQNQINEIAGRLNPRLLGRSASTTDGAPIVSDSGVVESGNGRTLAIRQAYARGNGEAYRDWLLEQGYNTGGMEQPVLVRVRRSELSPEDLQEYTRESNQRTTLSLSPTEQAMADAGKVMPIIEDFTGGDINAAGNRDFVRKFVRDVVGQSERADMVDSAGMLSQEGRRRVEAAMMAAAYGDPGIVTDMFESADTDIKAIGGALMDAAGKWAQMRQRSAEGSIAEGMDLTDNLIDAVNLIRRARAEGKTLPDLINQRDAFDGDIDPATEGFLRIFYRGDNLRKARGRDKVADALNFYADQALASQPGAGLFGDTVTGSQVLEATNERQRQQEGEQPAGTGRDAEDTRPPRGERQGSRTEAVREEAGQEAEPAAEPAEDVAPILESYTEEEIRQREADQQAAREAEAAAEREAEQRAQADEQLDDFTLTGSDRISDVAAARGQDDMFVAAQTAPEPEPDTNTYNGEPIVTHTTKRGRELEGVVRDVPLSEAKEIDPYAFRKDGGSFIRLDRLREAEGANDAPGNTGGLESDRGDAEVAQPGDGQAVQDEPAGADAGTGSAGGQNEQGRSPGQGDQRVSDDGATAGGERSNQPLYNEDGTFAVEDGAAGDTDSGGGSESGSEREPVERRREAATFDAAPSTRSPDVVERKRLQKEAEGTPTTWGNTDNIREALPLLLPEQQQDVVKAEKRLFTQAANGMMFTNSTGTGKTAVSLGQAKRFINAGQDNIIIVVPSDKIAGDFVDFAKMLNIPLKQLSGINDNGGSGPVITTYANFAQNDSLTEREWDLVITDEAHKLSSAADGRPTDALRKLRALTGHHEGFYPWVTSRYSEEYSAVREAADALNQARESRAPQAEQQRLSDEFKEAEGAWQEIMRAERPAWERRWKEQTGIPKTIFLSATPFPYVKNTDYAEGYLFHYRPPAQAFDPEPGGYNTPNGREAFMMQHFGYRMRYGKLTAPEAGVESELLEQNFNQWLQDEGALSGRALDVPHDYDRRFMLVDDAVGSRIDEALQWLSEAEDGKYRPVGELIRKSFDYQSRMYLLEAIKAKHVIPKIKAELKLGRKVVVFHDFKKGGGTDPFKAVKRGKTSDRDLNALIDEAFAKRPDFLEMKLEGLNSPITTLQRAFPDILLFNGDVPKRERRKNASLFNAEDSGRDLILVQSAAGQEGISFHDTTGNRQRALYNLGMPTRPVAAIQIEGRIYRTGQASDAIFRYLTTGTAWEAAAFGSTIAERASTAENLALGTAARGLKQAFVEAYRGAQSFSPSKSDGKGGKEFDRSLGVNQSISEFQKAKTFYYAQQKNAKRRDQREGQDYFATPEPVGLKMVEFADIRPGDKVLEPSAGHGAIARFIPDLTDVTMVEPSYELSQKAALANGKAKIINGKFEDLNVVNKYDAIVMNPPYGSGGKTSTEHLAKAARHIRDGGRIVALLPRGGMADKRLADYLESEDAKNLHMVARVDLPSKTFDRAGTSVNTQIIVLERRDTPEAAAAIQGRHIDLSNAEKVTELFDRIEPVEMPERARSIRGEDPATSFNPEPLTVEDLDQIVRSGPLGPVIGGLIDAGSIRLHTDPEALFGEDAAYGTQAATDERGIIHLIAENLEEGYVFPTLLHEAFHGGVRPLIGGQQWDNLQRRLGQLYRQYQRSGGRAKDFWQRAKDRIDYAQRMGDTMSEKRIIEEFGAYAIEEYENAPASLRKWVDDLIGAVKAWLQRKFGIQAGQVTPAQLRALSIAALRNGDFAQSPSMDGVVFSDQTTTQTAAFRRWFGDSKVVDENGQPLVVYHGAPDARFVREDGIFKGPERFGMPSNGRDRAFWFAKSRRVAATYADDMRAFDYQAAEPGVIEAYLKLENPLVIDGKGKTWREAQERGKTSDVIEQARQEGRDGVIIRNVRDNYNDWEGGARSTPTDTYVVFNSEQIKSATDNSGAFDPNNPSIVRSVNDNLPTATVEEITDESEIERIRAEYGSRQGRQAAGRNLAGRPAPADWQQKTRIRAGEGQPAILYHGSAEGLKPGDFSRERMGFATGHPSAMLGVYFTNSRRDAAYYGDVEDFYADIRNPFVISGADLPGFSSPEEAAAYRADIEALGHDGMVIDYTGLGGPQHIIPFKARQVIRPEAKQNGAVQSIRRPPSKRPEDQFNDLTAGQKSFLGKIGPRTFPQRMGDRWRELTDNLGLRIRQAGVDRYAALLRNDRALFAEDTLEGSIASSSWVLARMSEAAGGALSAMVNAGRIYLDPDQKVIDVREGTTGFSQTMRQLGSPAEIDRFMAWVAANRSKRLAAEGRENLFTPEEIEEGIKLSAGRTEEGSARGPLYAKVWKEFQQYRDDVLGIAETAGIITPEQRETWAEEFYVPFYRVLDDDTVGGPKGGSGLSRQKAYQKLKGGRQNLNDLLENTLLNFHHLIQASLKNQAAIQAVDNAIELEIAEPTPESRRDKKASTFIMRGGEKEWYNIGDPLTFKAISALSDVGMNNTAMKIGRGFKRFFTNMTTITPQFVIANTLRDSLSAIATSPASFNVTKNIAQGAMTFGNDFDRARMLASGGAFAFGHVYARDPEEVKLNLTKDLRKAEVLRDPRLVPNILLGAWRRWNDVTNFAENVNRAAIWKQNQGNGKLKAAFEARDLMDFSVRGDSVLIRILTDLVPFLNARIQGLDKLYRAGVRTGYMTLTGKGNRAEKLAFARFMTVVGALSAVSMALFLRNWDDEEYRKLEDWQRDTYWVIRIGDSMYFIPKPFEVGAIATMAERGLEQFVDPNVGGRKFAERVGHMLTDTFAFNPIPQVLKPMYELGVNEDTFTGRPIEGMGMQRLSPSLRSNPDTSRFAEYLSLGMENTLGVFGPGAENMALSPLQIDHLVRGYTGQTGAFAVGLADTMWRRAAGEEKPASNWYEYQPIRRFYRNLADEDTYTRYGTLFYDTMKRADRAYADLKKLDEYGELERAAKVEESEAIYLAMRKTLNQISRELSAINRDMKRIRQDKGMSGEAKRLELDRLRSIRNLILEDVGQVIEEEKAAARD